MTTDHSSNCRLLNRVVFIACLLLLLMPSTRSVAQNQTPNIVFFYADDLGYGDIACYGHPYAKTPHIDRLARDGTRFTQAYSTGSTCNPARVGYMTGKFPASFARFPADFGFGDRVTISELLKQKGYVTGHFGKWHIGPTRKQGTYGLDTIMDGQRSIELGKDAGIYDETIKFIKANKDNAFYVNVWGRITHFPVNPPQHYADRFKNIRVDPADFGPTMHRKFKQVRSLGQDIDTGMRNFLGEVMALDEAVGRVLATIDKLGIADKTIVVFSSDQGAAPVVFNKSTEKDPKLMANMLGSAGPFRGGKHTTLEGGVRTPFIARWPGVIPAGNVDRESVISGIDWLPTLCAIAGIEIDTNDFDGEDVSHAWLGQQKHIRTKPLFWRNPAPGGVISMRYGKWKAYLRRNGKAVKLYDVTIDPLEQHDVATDHPKVVTDLRTRSNAWATTLPRKYATAKKKD